VSHLTTFAPFVERKLAPEITRKCGGEEGVDYLFVLYRGSMARSQTDNLCQSATKVLSI